MKKNNNGEVCKKPVTEREFIVKETFNGTRKLSEILADLIYSEYCRKEQKNVR
jgi:hypothetical protein